MQACDYYKAVPKELDSFFTGYKPYSENTHFQKSDNFNTKSDNAAKQLQDDKQDMKYSDCKNMCNADGDCMIECLSFEHNHILTHYYYKETDGQDGCTWDQMDEFFQLKDKNCAYVVNKRGNYFEFQFEKGDKLTYNFRSGKFERAGKLVEVSIAEGSTSTEEIAFYEINTIGLEKLTISIDKKDYYCFNAFAEINKDYAKQISQDCDINSFQFINTNFLHNTQGSNFIDSFHFDFKSLSLFEINKRLVSLKAIYENGKLISYYFRFNTNQCYDHFLTFVDALLCSKDGYIYNFVFKKDGIFFLYKLNIKTLEANEFNFGKTYFFQSIKAEDNKVIITTKHAEDIREMEIITTKYEICSPHLKAFENFTVSFKDKTSTTEFKEGIFSVSKNIIMINSGSEYKELVVSHFKVRELEDNYKLYNLYDDKEYKITPLELRTKHSFVKELSNALCHTNNNEFYFTKENGKIFGKITLNDQNSAVKIENFNNGRIMEFLNESFELISNTDETTSFKLTDYTKDWNLYHVYTDLKCNEILKAVRNSMVFCPPGFKFSLTQTKKQTIEELTENYVEPKEATKMEGNAKNNLLYDVGHSYFKNNFAILNLSNQLNIYLVQLISKEPINGGFQVVRLWFPFDNKRNKTFCKNKFVHFINSHQCDQQFYIVSEDQTIPKGLATFQKGNNSGTGHIVIGKSTLLYNNLNLQNVKKGIYKMTLNLTMEGGLQMEDVSFFVVVPWSCGDYISELTNTKKKMRLKRNFIR
jgi:hypothetical protein